jgi:restriction system protein
MPRRNENIFEMLVELPWWVSVIVAFIAYIGIKFIIPAIIGGSPFFNGIARGLSSWAKWVALFFLILGAISALFAWRRGELLRGQTSIRTIHNLSWRHLEELVGEAYRQVGYSVVENSGPGADGGVDLIAQKDGETILIQCKQWKARKIGVKTVREMFGLFNSERANEVHIITSGEFTDEAKDFARNKPIKLIDGPMLVQLVGRAQAATISKGPPVSEPPRTYAGPKVICPICGSKMILRKATKGANTGKEFWGCEKFPPCRGVRDIK